MIALSPHLPMTRIQITEPQSINEWNALPKEFLDYLDAIDDYCENSNQQYQWNVDSSPFPLQYIIDTWNSEDALPSVEEMVKDIEEGYEDAALESWAVSRYL